MILNELIKKIERKKILVIGDVMIDNYYFGDSKRISPEAPVPILLEKSRKMVLGGAANVALNLVAANQDVYVMSLIGNDEKGNELLSMLEEKNVDTSLIIKDTSRCTIVKNRFIGQNNIQMFRFDQEINKPIDNDVFEELYKKIVEKINIFDVMVISDYNKGLLTLENTPRIISLANKYNVKIIVDIKEPKYEKYYGAYLIKPNLKELGDITGLKINSDKEIETALRLLKNNTNCQFPLVTRSGDGMTLLVNDSIKNFKCASKEVYDVTGAGDTVISYLAVGIANNFNIDDCINISNYAAGVKVSKMGTYAVTPNDIEEFILDENNILDENKIIKIDDLVDKLTKEKNKKIVFTNGCFDIFHVGHLRYLKESAKYGDMLIVGLNSDSSVKKIKGNNRPIVNQKERAEMIASLNFVSYVVIFDEETPYEIIKKINPMYITKGGDYNPKDVIGRDIVLKNGGDVVICPLVENKSTTNIIKKILEVYNG